MQQWATSPFTSVRSTRRSPLSARRAEGGIFAHSLLHLVPDRETAPYVEFRLSKARLHSDVEAAGFVGLETPDVGAEAIVDFLVARKRA
jgi:hypothetical protein